MSSSGGEDRSFGLSFQLPFDPTNAVPPTIQPGCTSCDFGKPDVDLSNLNFTMPPGLNVNGLPFSSSNLQNFAGKFQGYKPDALLLPDFQPHMLAAFKGLSGGGIDLPVSCLKSQATSGSGSDDASTNASQIQSSTAPAPTDPPGMTHSARVAAFGEGGLSLFSSLASNTTLPVRGALFNNVAFNQKGTVMKVAELSMSLFQTAAEAYSSAEDLLAALHAADQDYGEAAICVQDALGYLEESGLDFLKCEAHQLADTAGSSIPAVGGFVQRAEGGIADCAGVHLSAGNCDIITSLAVGFGLDDVLKSYNDLSGSLKTLNSQIETIKTMGSQAGPGLTLNDVDVLARPFLTQMAKMPGGFLAQASAFLEGVLSATDGNGLANSADIAMKGGPDLNIDLGPNTPNLSNLGAAVATLPFLSNVAGLASGAFGGRAAAAAPQILKAMDEAPLLEVVYPPAGKVIGITTDHSTLTVIGTAADWLPHLVELKVQADNGPIITTALDLHTLHTDAGGATGRAAWMARVPVPHGGLNDLHVWAVNAGGNRTDLHMPVFLDGTQFPQQGTVARGVTSFIWQSENSGILFGLGASVTAKAVGRVTYLDAMPGEAPLAGPMVPGAGSNRVRVLYPDGSPDPDLVAVDAAGNTFAALGEGLYSLPAGSAQFFLRLKPVYRGKSFVNLAGNADALGFKRYKVQYVDGWLNTGSAFATPPLDGAEAFGFGNTRAAVADDFIRPDRRVTDSAMPVHGGIYRYLDSWDVSSQRLAGRFTLRTVLTDTNAPDPFSLETRYDVSGTTRTEQPDLVRPSGEKDRCFFYVGTPVDNTSTARGDIIVPDPYIRAQGLFPAGLIKQFRSVNLYADDAPVGALIPDPSYAALSPVYEFFPHLASSEFNNTGIATDPNNSVRFSIKYSKEDLDFDPFGPNPDLSPVQKDKRRGIIEKNLGIYRLPACASGPCVAVPLDTELPLGSYSVFTRTRDLSGKFILMPGRLPAIVDPSPAAVPFIFSPETAPSGSSRAKTTVNFQVFSPTSNRVRVEVRVYPENAPADCVAVLRDDINQAVDSPLHYLGDNADPL